MYMQWVAKDLGAEGKAAPNRNYVVYMILNWGPVPHVCPLEALQPVWLMPKVYCTIIV
jgi:hypothetical protein